jgi:hypothetical protein
MTSRLGTEKSLTFFTVYRKMRCRHSTEEDTEVEPRFLKIIDVICQNFPIKENIITVRFLRTSSQSLQVFTTKLPNIYFYA